MAQSKISESRLPFFCFVFLSPRFGILGYPSATEVRIGPVTGLGPRGTVITNPSRCSFEANRYGHPHYRLSAPLPPPILDLGITPHNRASSLDPPSAPFRWTLGNGDHLLALPPCAMLVMSSGLHAREWSVVSTCPSCSGVQT